MYLILVPLALIGVWTIFGYYWPEKADKIRQKVNEKNPFRSDLPWE